VVRGSSGLFGGLCPNQPFAQSTGHQRSRIKSDGPLLRSPLSPSAPRPSPPKLEGSFLSRDPASLRSHLAARVAALSDRG